MYKIKGERGVSLVVEDGWIDKRTGGQSLAEASVADYEGVESRRYSQRRFILVGRMTEHLKVTINAGKPIILRLPVDREAEVAELRAALDRAKAAIA